MILTISNSSSLGDHNLEYNLEKVRRQDATIIHAQGIRIFSERFHPDSEQVRQEFMRYLRCGYSPNALPFTHISINPDPKDDLSALELREIARALMAMGGLSDCPYLAFRHQDAHHDHIHLLICRIHQGRMHIGKMRTFRDSLKLEDTFQLHKKELRLFKKERIRLERVCHKEGNLTDQAKGCLRAIQTLYDFTDLETYRDLAAGMNIHIAVSKDRESCPQAISHFITDDEGHTVSSKIPTHALGSRYALKSVLEMADRNLLKAERPSLLEPREDPRDEVMRNISSSSSLEETLESLLRKGIELRRGRNGSLLLLCHQTGAVQREDAKRQGGLMDALLERTRLDNPRQIFFLLEGHRKRSESQVLGILARRIQALEKKSLRFSQH